MSGAGTEQDTVGARRRPADTGVEHMWDHAEYWAILSTDRAGQKQQTVQSSCTESSQPAWQRDTHKCIESTQITVQRDTAEERYP